MEELFLIYVNYVGETYDEKFIYEFLFSDTINNIDGEDWDKYPASGRPSPPNIKMIKRVGVLTSELKFDVIQESDTFAVWDAVDGVIALAWENVNTYDSYPEFRISFKFGETINSVEDKLYEKELTLKYKEKNKLV